MMSGEKTIKEQRKEQPLVSIITPSFNQGQFIEETILSVKNQGYPNVEHIIVDGGSTDNTLEILKKYESTYDMRWISERDEGQYDAINKGFRKAKGDILGWINSDDVYVSDAISKIVDCFIAHTEAEVLYGGWYHINEKNSILMARQRVRPFDLKRLRRYDFINPSATFIRASIIHEGFFLDHSIAHFGDWDWYLRIASAGWKFYFLDEKLCYFRIHSNSRIAMLDKSEAKKQRLVISRRHNIPLWQIEFWDDFLLPWRSRLFKLRILLHDRNVPEIFRRSKKVLWRYLGINTYSE